MPFDWLHPNVSRPTSRREEVCREELKERAAMLYRLHYPAARAKARLTANLGWDYEVGSRSPPIAASEVGAIVDAVYGRHGAGGGPLAV